jgi:hypothetical protein
MIIRFFTFSRGLKMVSFLMMAFLAALTPAHAGEKKIVVGEVEDVILLPWGIKLPARIDTGAAISSLDAQDLKVKDGFAEFTLPQRYGGMKLRLPIADWRNIRSSEASERRPIVEIEICIGSRRVLARVNLNDRSSVKYPLLIGRDALRENFIVDCKQERCSPPSCPEVPLK